MMQKVQRSAAGSGMVGMSVRRLPLGKKNQFDSEPQVEQLYSAA